MPKRAVLISFELWRQWMTQGYEVHVQCTRGLPDDAKCVKVFNHPLGLCAVLESPNLESLKNGECTVTTPEGELVGYFDPEFTTIYSDDE